MDTIRAGAASNQTLAGSYRELASRCREMAKHCRRPGALLLRATAFDQAAELARARTAAHPGAAADLSGAAPGLPVAKCRRRHHIWAIAGRGRSGAGG